MCRLAEQCQEGCSVPVRVDRLGNAQFANGPEFPEQSCVDRPSPALLGFLHLELLSGKLIQAKILVRTTELSLEGISMHVKKKFPLLFFIFCFFCVIFAKFMPEKISSFFGIRIQQHASLRVGMHVYTHAAYSVTCIMYT